MSTSFVTLSTTQTCITIRELEARSHEEEEEEGEETSCLEIKITFRLAVNVAFFLSHKTVTDD